jgi:hypothetical protein
MPGAAPAIAPAPAPVTAAAPAAAQSAIPPAAPEDVQALHIKAVNRLKFQMLKMKRLFKDAHQALAEVKQFTPATSAALEHAAAVQGKTSIPVAKLVADPQQQLAAQLPALTQQLQQVM